jgi:hypothetical protein
LNNGRSVVDVEQAGPGVEATQPARSKTSRVLWAIILAFVGSALTVVAAICSCSIFVLIMFMYGMGAQQADYIQRLRITAEIIAGGVFVVAIASIISIVIRIHRRFGD